MASSAETRTSSVKMCGGVISRLVYACAKRKGVDVGPPLKQAGLTEDLIKDKNAQVGVANQIKFVELVAEALGDDLLGFHLAEDIDPREMGLLYYVAASADTMGDALRRGERYIKLQNEAVRFKVSAGKSVRVRMQYTGIARYTDVHQISAFISLLIKINRQLTGRELTPTRVRVMHKVAGDKAKLERYLDATVEDGADVDEVEFPGASWDLPLISADPYLHRLLVENCEAALARRHHSATPLKVEVENEIAALLPHGQARHDVVAAKLGMSPRTLARRLSAEGSSFAAILDAIRSALAHRYLTDRTLPISQIAWLVGYTEIGTFTRAFQRWTGMSPSAARAQHEPAR
jgi:AraC-like DNA-binding protein